MANPTKVRASLWNAYSHAASTAGTFSDWQDLGTTYPSTLNISLKNGATGPTIEGMAIVQIANDYNSGSPTHPITMGGENTGTDSNSGTTFFGPIELEVGIAAVRVGIGSNTGQAVVYSADLGIPTGIA